MKLLTVWTPGVSSFTVWFTPGVKLGTSFTGVTSIVRMCVTLSTPPLAVPPLSDRMHVERAAAVGVGRRRVGERAVERHRRTRRERERARHRVRRHLERQRLRGFLRGTGAHRGRPAGHRLRARCPRSPSAPRRP